MPQRKILVASMVGSLKLKGNHRSWRMACLGFHSNRSTRNIFVSIGIWILALIWDPLCGVLGLESRRGRNWCTLGNSMSRIKEMGMVFWSLLMRYLRASSKMISGSGVTKGISMAYTLVGIRMDWGQAWAHSAGTIIKYSRAIGKQAPRMAMGCGDRPKETNIRGSGFRTGNTVMAHSNTKRVPTRGNSKIS